MWLRFRVTTPVSLRVGSTRDLRSLAYGRTHRPLRPFVTYYSCNYTQVDLILVLLYFFPTQRSSPVYSHFSVLTPHFYNLSPEPLSPSVSLSLSLLSLSFPHCLPPSLLPYLPPSLLLSLDPSLPPSSRKPGNVFPIPDTRRRTTPTEGVWS